MRDFTILFSATVRETLRERWGVASMIVLALVFGAMPHVATALFPDEPGAPPKPPSRSVPCVADAGLPAVSFVGEVPPWLQWWEPPVSTDDADVLVRIEHTERVRFDVVPLHRKARASVVRTCLWERVRAERDRRLLALGIVERPWDVAELKFETRPPATPKTPEPSPGEAGTTD